MTMTVARQFARNSTAGVLVAILGCQPGLAAQTQLVTPAELQKEAAAHTRTRQQNRDTVTAFLTSPEARRVLGSAPLGLERVKAAVSSLNDQELARLAARSEKVQADFAAGRITDRDL